MLTRFLEATRHFVPQATTIVLAAFAVSTVSCSLSGPAALPPTESAQSIVGTLDVVSRGAVLFDGPLAELYPCHDGDMVAYRVEGGPRSGEIMVSRTFALPKAGDFRIANTFSGELIEALHLRVDGETVSVVSQVDTDRDVGMTFARPMPIVSTPLYEGTIAFRSPVRIWRPSSGRTMGEGDVTLTLSVDEDQRDEFDMIYMVTHAGTFKLMRQVFEVESTAWLVPGLGEVEGQRVEAGTDTETFTLVCARISGNDVVDCGPFTSELGE